MQGQETPIPMDAQDVQSSQKELNDQIQQLISQYQNTLVDYSTQSESLFQKAYSALVSASAPDAFDSLLKLELNYASTLDQHWDVYEKELERIEVRHARELERLAIHKISNTNEVKTKHAEV